MGCLEAGLSLPSLLPLKKNDVRLRCYGSLDEDCSTVRADSSPLAVAFTVSGTTIFVLGADATPRVAVPVEPIETYDGRLEGNLPLPSMEASDRMSWSAPCVGTPANSAINCLTAVEVSSPMFSIGRWHFGTMAGRTGVDDAMLQ